jgi:hypothetical protein
MKITNVQRLAGQDDLQKTAMPIMRDGRKVEAIPQAAALAYIEEMAAWEAAES